MYFRFLSFSCAYVKYYQFIVDVPIPIKASVLALPLNQVYNCIIDHNDNKNYHTNGTSNWSTGIAL